MKIRLLYILLIVCLSGVSPNLIQAQHELGLHAGYGSGFGAGIDYSFEVAPRWRIQTGLGMASLSTDSKYDKLNFSQIIATPPGLPVNSLFYFNADINNLKEEWELSFLNIPLLLEFQTRDKQAFYAAAGIKFGIPLSGTYRQDFDQMITSGFSDYTNQTYENMPNQGFSTYNKGSSEEKPDLSLSYIAAVRMGMKWSLAKNVKLITGLYLDYGLNDSWKNEKDLVEYRASGQHKMNSASDAYSSLSYGVELGISVTFGKSRKAEKRSSPGVNSPVIIVPQQENTVLFEENPLPEEEKINSTEAVEMINISDDRKSYDYDMLILLQPVSRYSRNQVNPGRFQMDLLEEKIPLLLAYPEIHILIKGHTDSEESGSGIRRAEAAKHYLVSRGITSERIQVVDKGDCCPVASENGSEDKGKNRRVEFVIL